MNQDDLVKNSMEYFNSIAHTIGDRLSITDAMILVTRAYEEGYRDGWAHSIPLEQDFL